MAFGQAAGPPAGMRQIEELAALLERAGFSSFREARHPYGLTQRQAAGKFTAPEAAELIDRLNAAEIVQQSVGAPDEDVDVPDAPPRRPATARAAGRVAASARTGSVDATRTTAQRPRSAASLEAQRRREERRAEQLNALSDEAIVAELERRGWCCIPPLQDPPIDPG